MAPERRLAGPWNKRVSDEDVVAAYVHTGSVWKAAKRLGLAGQSVHERLRRLNFALAHEKWTSQQLREAVSLARHGETLSEIAARINRTYAAVALKLSRLGVRSRRNDWRRKPKRGGLMTKAKVAELARLLENGSTSVRRLARREGVAITPLVDALQFHEPKRWWRYVVRSSRLGVVVCPGCRSRFLPLTKKQRFCTVRCRETNRRDRAYFGGRRMEAIGLREGVCQLCHRKFEKWLAAHHVLGKENDPDNEALIALCRGCHDVLTRLSAKPWVERPEFVADLIALALARRGRNNAFVPVEIEDWTPDEIRDHLSSLLSPTASTAHVPVAGRRGRLVSRSVQPAVPRRVRRPPG